MPGRCGMHLALGIAVMAVLYGPCSASSSEQLGVASVRLDLPGQRVGLDRALTQRQESIQKVMQLPEWPQQAGLPFDLHPLIISGPAENRVDLVFFSDGYVESERSKFLGDSRRLAEDISGNQTFNTVKPLLNFWAAFSASKESGIGVGGKPKDTVFGLYRNGTELRAVYYDKPEVASEFCSSLGEQCDYPILLGNDPYYGGLGGEFTVVTSSLANGPLVLRHELGHSIIDVGEEYDGGYAYYGVNSAQNLTTPVTWTHWLSNSSADPNFLRVERSVMPMQAYPWTLLNSSIPWSISFASSGLYSRHLVKFSLSGLPEVTDVAITFDGESLDWKPRPDIGLDRWHYNMHRSFPLGQGDHEIKFTLLNENREGSAQLCSVEVLEFGDEDEFVSTPGHYGIFPTFSDTNTSTYRPTNEDCLMRAVTTPNFCRVCLEELWLSLLRRVNLIDGITESCQERAIEENGTTSMVKTIDVRLIPLAHMRSELLATTVEESYTITWYKDGRVLSAFTNKTVLEIGNNQIPANYTLLVRFATEEVRRDDIGLESRQDIVIAQRC